MKIARTSLVLKYAPAVMFAAFVMTCPLLAQTGGAAQDVAASAYEVSTSVPVLLAKGDSVLPEAPQPQGGENLLPSSGYKGVDAMPTAPRYTKYIAAGERAQAITAHDKVVIGLKDLVNPLNFVAMFVTSGYEQVTNGEPNYGRDRGAFGERLGAAAIRESTQGLFTDSVFAPILREDPRYYVKGQGHSFVNRTVYAITRPLITRTDSGKSTVNGALLLGYASSSALSYAYYPKINQNYKDTASTFGGSIGGAAIGFFVSEFSSDFLQALHMKKR